MQDGEAKIIDCSSEDWLRTARAALNRGLEVELVNFTSEYYAGACSVMAKVRSFEFDADVENRIARFRKLHQS